MFTYHRLAAGIILLLFSGGMELSARDTKKPNCPPNSGYDPTRGKCVCRPGLKYDSSAKACVDKATTTTCPRGQVLDRQRNRCRVECTAGQVWDQNRGACVLAKCPATFVQQGNQCVCPKGMVNQGGKCVEPKSPTAGPGRAKEGEACGRLADGRGNPVLVQCEAGTGLTCRPPGALRGTCQKSPTAAGRNRVETRQGGLCGQVTDPKTRAVDTVTCQAPLQCAKSTKPGYEHLGKCIAAQAGGKVSASIEARNTSGGWKIFVTLNNPEKLVVQAKLERNRGSGWEVYVDNMPNQRSVFQEARTTQYRVSLYSGGRKIGESNIASVPGR